MSNKSSNIQNYFPKEMKYVIKGLGDDVRLSIIEKLMKNTKLPYNEIKKQLGLNSSSLSYHLSLLQDGGLVNNFLEFKDNSHSYYKVTELTYDVLESLYRTVFSMPITEASFQRMPSSRFTLEESPKISFEGGTNITSVKYGESKEAVMSSST
jgi:DNA-binding transcriptional ArsR family regulator